MDNDVLLAIDILEIPLKVQLLATAVHKYDSLHVEEGSEGFISD